MHAARYGGTRNRTGMTSFYILNIQNKAYIAHQASCSARWRILCMYVSHITTYHYRVSLSHLTIAAVTSHRYHISILIYGISKMSRQITQHHISRGVAIWNLHFMIEISSNTGVRRNPFRPNWTETWVRVRVITSNPNPNPTLFSWYQGYWRDGWWLLFLHTHSRKATIKT
jgi:hypothetical protein